MMDRQKLITFLKRCVYEGGRGQKLTDLRLFHKGGDARSASVDEWEFKEDIDLEELATSIGDIALEDANNIGDMQEYVLNAYYDHKSTASRRFQFVLYGQSSDESDGVTATEAPNERGLIKMLMRSMTEDRKVFMDGFKETSRIMRDMLRQQADRANTLEARNLDTVEAYEQVMSLKHERDLEAKKAEKKEERNDMLLKLAIKHMPDLAQQIMPALVTRISGEPPALGTGGPAAPPMPPTADAPAPSPTGPKPKTGPAAASPSGQDPSIRIVDPDEITIGVADLLEDLDPKQQEEIFKILKPEQVMMLGLIAKRGEEAKKGATG